MKSPILFIAASLFVATTFAQDKKAQPATKVKQPASSIDKAATPSPDAAAEKAAEKAWMMYMTPGEMQKRLSMDEGDWKEDCTFWMAPGAPATKAESKCTNKMVLDGRYLESVHSGMMMGMPFEGHGTIGYDNALHIYQSTWIDNMGTGIMFLQGKWDDKSKSVTYTGKAVSPDTGKEEHVRQVYTIVDDNTRKLEMYYTKDGKEFKNMEIVMTR